MPTLQKSVSFTCSFISKEGEETTVASSCTRNERILRSFLFEGWLPSRQSLTCFTQWLSLFDIFQPENFVVLRIVHYFCTWNTSPEPLGITELSLMVQWGIEKKESVEWKNLLAFSSNGLKFLNLSFNGRRNFWLLVLDNWIHLSLGRHSPDDLIIPVMDVEVVGYILIMTSDGGHPSRLTAGDYRRPWS